MTSPSSKFRVLKFGGAALRDGAAVRRACEIVANHGGPRPVVIVSALEGVTALLEELAEGRGETQTIRIRHRSLLNQLELTSELLDSFLRELERLVVGLKSTGSIDRASRDHLLSFGERMSARIVAAALRNEGFSATPVDAHDLGIVTDNSDGEVRLLSSAASNVRIAIDEVQGVPVVTGFLAADERGNLTTLGSNGSDLTALFVAEAINAEEVQLWKCVAGIQTADPKFVPYAQTIDEIGCDEAIELARLGARVLHIGAAQEAKRANVTLRLLDVSKPAFAGTRVVSKTARAGLLALVHRPFDETHSIVSILRSGIGTHANLDGQVIDSLNLQSIQSESFEAGEHERSQSWLIQTSDLKRALTHLHDELFSTVTVDQSANRSLQQQAP